jgi:hypothetical protein
VRGANAHRLITGKGYGLGLRAKRRAAALRFARNKGVRESARAWVLRQLITDCARRGSRSR